MEGPLEASRHALYLLISGDPALWSIVGISFRVSLQAILIATPVALLIAFLLAYLRFPGRRSLISVFQTLQALPAVAVGLIVYLLLTRNGPLGDMKLLFTQTAMVVGQVILAFPLLVALAYAAIQAADRRVWETARTLRAAPGRAMLTLMYEIRLGLIAVVVAGFARIVSEVGTSVMVGGNILGVTRNIPTAIALETSKGEYAQGIALGFVLVTLALLLNYSLGMLQARAEHR